MRATTDLPREPRRRTRTGRGRTWLIAGGVLLFILLTSLRGIAGFYTDFLWFESLGFEGVFTGVLGAKIALAVIFIGLFFVAMWVNLLIADRIAPKFRPPGPEEEMIERFEELVGERQGLLRVLISLFFALTVGVGASDQWEEWILFTNGSDFGINDPQFGTDIGFYVFRLPFLSFVAGWAFAALLIILIVTSVAHYLNGGIRVQAPGPRVTSQVKAHLSVLLGLLALVRAVGYWLQRFELTVSTRGTVDGATYTDVNAQLPAIQLLLLISIASFGLFIVNIWRRGWVLPVLGVGLWALVAVVAGGIYPQFVQRFQVEPSELSRESPFIDENIEATRFAMGLDEVETERYPYIRDVGSIDLTNDAPTVANIRLWDPNASILGKTYQQLQATRDYYVINDVDVDRYQIDGQETQVVLSVRDLQTSGVPQKSWEAEHLVFTHGHGVVVASSNAKTAGGRPDFFVSDVPATVDEDKLDVLGLDNPAVYFGEELSGYVVTGSTREELDYQDEEETVFTRYDGADGVSIGSLPRKAAFALRFGDINPLISDTITGESKIHYIRDVKERVSSLAPFLHFDNDPYPVVHEGRIVWIMDAYTTSDKYPYAQRADVSDLPGGSGLDHRFNYVRNSVKAVVDAYDGTVDFYVIDEEDPIINAYRGAFPELFADFADMPENLKAHLRYPEELFRVQTNMWARYHLTEAQDFYNNNDAWEVSADPGTEGAQGQTQTTDAQTGEVTSTRAARIDPYYLQIQLPGTDQLDFAITRPFAPFSDSGGRPQLTALMTASSDPGTYGQLRVLEMPPGNLPDGPTAIEG
ncbi:MAG TPA: UPF0182 family protein, partial [Acidimicrobiales bacterium]|nr:UPF0182 family protein [Acidimicrobiales bacterium]